MVDTKTTPKNNKQKITPERLARETKALRDNLRKRKEQQAARQMQNKGK